MRKTGKVSVTSGYVTDIGPTQAANFRINGPHVATDTSHAAFRPRQLGPVKAKFLADAAYNARVKDLARSAKRNFRLPPFVVDYDHDWALPSLLMSVVEATSAVG